MTSLEKRVFRRQLMYMAMTYLAILAGIAATARQSIRDGILWIALPLGLAIALASAAYAVRTSRRAARSTDDLTMAGFVIAHRIQVELPLPVADTLRLAEAAVRGLEPELEVAVHPDRGLVYALQVTGKTWSAGSLVRVALAPSPGAAGSTRAVICTGPVAKMTMNDYGQSERNAQAIARALNDAVAEMQQAQRDSAERATLQAQLDRARLGLLQAQVEPHFLYNTLANVQLLIRSDPAAADRMTADLIAYLRSSLPDFRGPESTVAREMALVNAFLGIMQIRMGTRLHTDTHVAPEVASAAIPPLLIHTLAENAIKHGLEPQPGGGRIEIRAVPIAAGRMRITVEDDGVGLRPEASGDGVGLANLCERLAILHGDAARFTIEAREPRGVSCTVEMPLKEAHDDAR